MYYSTHYRSPMGDMKWINVSEGRHESEREAENQRRALSLKRNAESQ